MKNQINSYRNPVIFFYNGIGDALFCLPTLRALTKAFDSSVTLICPEGDDNWFFEELSLRQVVKINAQYTNGVFEFDPHYLHKKIQNCDIFFSLVSWTSNSLILFLELLSPKISIGYFEKYDIYIPSLKTKNSFLSNFDSAKFLNPSLTLNDFSEPPIFNNDILSTAKLFLSNIKEGKRKKIISLHMETKKNKMWDFSKFSEFLDLFLFKNPDYIALIISASQMPIKLGKHENRVFEIFGFNFHFSCALISLSDLFLGVDSCMLHLADLCRIPGVGLFGETDPNRFGFYFSEHIHLKERNVLDINIEEVMLAINFFNENNRVT